MIKDKEYIIDANPNTTNKFGPPGSFKKKKTALESIKDVIPSISRTPALDLKYIVSL